MAWNGAPWPEWGSEQKTLDHVEYHGHAGEILDEKDGKFVIFCRTCILIHFIPIPSEAFLSEYYEKKFYQEVKVDYEKLYNEDREWWNIHNGYTLDWVDSRLKSSTRKVLDAGTGPGLFLDLARSKGWYTYGIEPNPKFCQSLWTSGHVMRQGMLNDSNPFTNVKFDLINAWEVAEHARDAELFFERCSNLLNPGGMLHIVVPNEYTQGMLEACRRYQLPRWWLAFPDHINYFTPKTAQLHLRRVGTFKIIDMRSTFPMVEHFILEKGLVYVGNPQLGRKCHHNRVDYEMEMYKSGKFELLMDEYRNNVADPYSGSVGRELHIVAVKE